MTRPLRPRDLLLAAVAVIVLAAGSTIAVAGASGGFTHRSANTVVPYRGDTASGQSCGVPALPGTTVRVQLIDMSAMMRGRGPMMGGGYGPMMGQDQWRQFRHGMMSVAAAPASITHGTVSLRVDNLGYLTHELVVLPLPAGQHVGSRAVGSDGKVDEAGSVGEASASCAAGAGEGIAPGSSGWVTRTLAAGRYELVCNLPGHYAAGMYAELDVA